VIKEEIRDGGVFKLEIQAIDGLENLKGDASY
jgi:hypothetical protein